MTDEPGGETAKLEPGGRVRAEDDRCRARRIGVDTGRAGHGDRAPRRTAEPPVRGSMMWWRSPPRTRQRRTATPEVARPPPAHRDHRPGGAERCVVVIGDADRPAADRNLPATATSPPSETSTPEPVIRCAAAAAASAARPSQSRRDRARHRRERGFRAAPGRAGHFPTRASGANREKAPVSECGRRRKYGRSRRGGGRGRPWDRRARRCRAPPRLQVRRRRRGAERRRRVRRRGGSEPSARSPSGSGWRAGRPRAAHGRTRDGQLGALQDR